MPDRTTARTIATLFLLYIAQGLPAGFQSKPLQTYLRLHGVSLAQIGFASALSLPWMMKALWAPLIDRFGSARFGRRKSWIVPLQLLLITTCGMAAFIRPEDGLPTLLALVFMMNLFAATQDIAVDGLAVDSLPHGELGPANAVQVIGFKVGILIAASFLLGATERIGWNGYFGVMALILFAVLLSVLPFRESAPALPPLPPAPYRAAPLEEAPPQRSLTAILATVLRALKAPGAGWLVLFIATYKIGESMVDRMFTPFLIDAGFTVAQISRLGAYDLTASIAGSLAGGLLARRMPLLRAVGVTALLRSVSMLGQWALAVSGPTPLAVIGVTVAEHFFGGALTTAMFAFMMSRVDRSVGATHYTVLANIEVLGKMPGGFFSGVLAEKLKYPRLFALGAALSFAFLLLLWPLRRSSKPLPVEAL